MDRSIAKFLEVLEGYKSRLEKVKSFLNPVKNVYQHLLDEAHDFSGVDEAAYAEELFEALTIENAERLTSLMLGKLSAFDDSDERSAFVTALGLSQIPAEERHTMEWIKKAEDALEDLKILSLADQLTEALKPFEGREDEFVVEARRLLTTEITKGWSKNVHESIKKLVDNKPRDIANEASRLLNRLKEELGEEGFDKDNRQIFFDARAFLLIFEPTTDWVDGAVLHLVEVQVEKTKIKASRTARWWSKNLPEGVAQKPVDDLQALLAETPEQYYKMLWTVRVQEALNGLKSFKPTCTDPGCNKHVGRKDGGKGPYFDKCKDHKPAVKTVAQVSAPAGDSQLAALKAGFGGW